MWILDILRKHWEENNGLRQINIIAALNGIYGSKAVNNLILKVSAKIGEAKRKRARIVQGHGF